MSLQEGYQRHMDQNSLLEQALADNRITEDQYKRMGGYNVLQNAPSYGPIKATPGDVGLASFGYNTIKGAANLFSGDAERGYGDIGYLDSIKKNYQGAKEGLQGDELELYSSIINPRSAFQDDYNIPQQTNMQQVYRRPPLNQTNYPQPNVPFGTDVDIQQGFTGGAQETQNPFYHPSMLEVAGTGQLPMEGITAADAAQEKGWLQNLMDNTFLGKMAAGTNPLNPNSGNFNPMLQGQLDVYGNYVDETGEDPLQGQNLVSGFGTNDIPAMLRKRLQRIRTRKMDQTDASMAKQAEILRAIKEQTAAENAGYQGTPGGNTGSGAFAKFDNTSKNYGPHTQGGGQGGQNNQGSKGSMPTGTAGKNPWGRAQGGYMRQGYSRGGRVGILSVF